MSQEQENNPTISDIATRCGVSHPTVSRVLRGTGRQSQATKEKVLRTAREMGYDPARSHAARRMISQRFGQKVLNNMISLWFPRGRAALGLKQPNHNVLLWSGVLQSIASTDFEVVTCDSTRVEYSDYLPESYRKGAIDGVLSTTQAEHWPVMLSKLRGEPNFDDRPIVGLVEHLEGASGVYADNTEAGRLAISHLLDLGHRSIGYFVFERELQFETTTHVLRLRAYQESYRQRGLSLDHLIPLEWTFGTEELKQSQEVLIESLRKHTEITAIIARNDMHAADIYAALVAAGYRVPQDISLIGYDDTDPIISNQGENILTTIRLPLMEIGKEGTNLLIRRILGEEKEDRDIVMPVELVVRKSTAPPNGLYPI